MINFLFYGLVLGVGAVELFTLLPFSGLKWLYKKHVARKKVAYRKHLRPFPCMASVGGRIRTLRSERQMTLDVLANAAGLSKGLLSKLENNEDANPSLDTLQKIADAFSLTLSDIIDSGTIQAKRIIPDQKPSWVDAITKVLQQEGQKPDDDILQALYVLQTRKGAAQKSDLAWLHMYRSLELNFRKGQG